MSKESFERSIKKNYVEFDKIRVKDKELVLNLLSYIDSKAPQKSSKEYMGKALSLIVTEQEKGKDAKKIIGKNYKDFAEGLMGIRGKK